MKLISTKKIKDTYTMHSIYNKSVNLLSDNKLYLITTNINYLSDNTYICSEELLLQFKQIPIGDKVELKHLELELLTINKQLLKNNTLLIQCIEEALTKNCLNSNLNLHTTCESYLGKDILNTAIETINNKHLNKKKILKFIGLGYGLTPCFDDLIYGHMFISHCLNQKTIINKTQIQSTNTTSISKEMLLNGQSNNYNLIFYKLIEYVNNNDKKNTNRAINEILKIGSSSGYYMLLGALYNLKNNT